MIKRPAFHRAFTGPVAVFAVFLGAQALSVSDTLAQSSGGYASDNPFVTVDLSVIDGGSTAVGAKSFAPGPGYSGTLIIPGPALPVSRLHVTPEGGAVNLPATEKNRVVLADPALSRVIPPAEPPVSSMDLPGDAPAKPLPAPSPEKMAMPEKPTPKKPAQTAAVAPPPKPEPPKPAKPAPAPAAAKPTDAPPPEPTVAAPAPPPPPKTAKAEPEPAKVAALTPAKEAKAEVGAATKILFDAGVSKLPSGSQDALKALVDKVIDQSNLRLQLLAYAGGDALSSSKARRLSLSRALSVRSFLIESGLRSTRIDVRALGNRTDEEPVNRVDINVVER